jgi:putative phosphoribosyl transferase
MTTFRDRTEAGQRVAQKLLHYRHRADVSVLALPRGGVPVGFEIATALGVPLDIFIVRKLGAPGQEELALGAIASGGIRVLNASVIHALGISDEALAEIAAEEKNELERRERLYRGCRPVPELRNQVVILTDDGLATGATMRAAVQAVRQKHPARVVVAVPVAAPDTVAAFEREVDEMICLWTPGNFYAIGLWYEDFSQTTDTEVRDLLERAATQLAHAAPSI